MDKDTLVATDREIEGAVIAALSRAEIPVTAVDWTWVPRVEEWQLLVVTSLADTEGPRQAYTKILAALSDAGVYQTIPVRRLFVKSPEDPIAKRVLQELKQTAEGSLHIIEDTISDLNHQYSIVFAPYLGSGGAIPSVRLTGDDRLRHFLIRRVGIPTYSMNEAFEQLSKRHSASIFNVQLNLRRAKQLNLVA